VDTVKEIRRRKGWSQKDLAEESGVGQDTISGIESGRHEPRPSTLRKLADALDVEVADFFREPALPLDEAPREAGPPQVSREKLVAQGIPVTDPEVDEVNYTIADLWRLVRGGKPVAYFPHEEVDSARVWMLIDLILDTPSVVTSEAADVVRQGMREKLKA
jgi:transcriptional regulator with XRE-family HTH domain